jgi:4-coumarate--CoA ligase
MIPPSQKVGTPGSGGQLIPGIRARVVKEDGSLAQCGEEGELFVTGPAIAMGYVNDQEA